MKFWRRTRYLKICSRVKWKMYAFFSQSDARNFFIYIIIKESVSICVDYLCRITWGFREKGVKPFWLTAQESTL